MKDILLPGLGWRFFIVTYSLPFIFFTGQTETTELNIPDLRRKDHHSPIYTNGWQIAVSQAGGFFECLLTKQLDESRETAEEYLLYRR